MTTATLRHGNEMFDRAGSAHAEVAAIPLGAGVRLTCESVEGASSAPLGTRLAYSSASRRLMNDSYDALREAHVRGTPIYGLTTGFGPLVTFAASQRPTEQGIGLVNHLACGWGALAPNDVVRATILLRAHTLGQGMSGVDPAAADALAALFESGLVPAVPAIGSVGASGDLIPLAHVARVLVGQGDVIEADRRTPASGALARAGLRPIALTGRDALAIVNGTSFMSAYAALAIARARRLLETACSLTGWIYRLLGCRSQALDPRLHAARGHGGQCSAARLILDEAAKQGRWEDASRPLQEVYSLRCAPQFLGACFEQLDHARRLVETEINGVNDNPVVVSEACDVLHGGNFQGQQVSFAGDAVNTALVQAAALVERQLDVLLNPEFNGGGPMLLAWQPGATSGLAGAQITATSIVAEMKLHQGPCATASMPTNGRNQDVVSMGTMSARAALEQTERASAVLSIACMAAEQLSFLRREGRAPGKPVERPSWAPSFEGIREDRALLPDVERIASRLLARATPA